jgi:PelA/Pel-15E family pectate lyase
MRNPYPPLLRLVCFAAVHAWVAAAAPDSPLIVEAESGTFSGGVDRHSCWHNVMLTDEPHSTHSGAGVVDTPNQAGSFIEVAYDATWAGPHRITVRYTHIKPDPRPGELWLNGKKGPVLALPQNQALPAFNTDSAVVDLPQGRNLIRLVALNAGGLGNVDYVKVAEVRELTPGALPRIVVLEAEDGLFQGKVDHHSCWNFIAQHPGPHTGFTGEGYVDADNKVGSYVEVTFDAPAAGIYQFAARYAHGKDDTRPAEVRVNGEVVAPSFAFGPTGFWTRWTYLELPQPVALLLGKNVVRLTALSTEGLVNLDHLRFTPAPTSTAPVRLSEATWGGVGCYKIEMPMGTVYFEKDNGVSGFKSFIDPAGNDWIASYMPPGPNGDFRGFPNSVGNFGHAGRDSGSTTVVVDGRTEGDHVILESSNADFTFQYWFFSDRIAVKVLRAKGDYCFLLETVAGGTADAADWFVGPDGVKRTPAGEFADFTPEWFYLGDPKAKHVLFLAKTPDDDAPNENHRQIRPNGMHNMDLYSFGRTGVEQKYLIRGMSGTEHVCVIGFLDAATPHPEIAATLERHLAAPFALPVPAPAPWSSAYLRHPPEWYGTAAARAVADSVLKYQSSQGGWPKSTDLARPPRTPADIPPEGRGRANSFDNDATTVPMQFLARIATATDDVRYRDAFQRGVDYLLAAQYPNGGWPQFWPLRGDYYDRITFNDGAMIRVMQVLTGVAQGQAPYAFVDKARRARAAAAVELGLACILQTQVRHEGRLAAWCAQHDEKTLAPAWARKYEPPSLSGSESVGITSYLMSIARPSAEVVAAIEGAVAWLRSVPLTGLRLDHVPGADGRDERRLVPDPAAPPLWARFYELGTNRPLYLDRDSVFRYDFMQVGRERRSGYNYLGTWPVPLLDRDYPAWRARVAGPAAGP